MSKNLEKIINGCEIYFNALTLVVQGNRIDHNIEIINQKTNFSRNRGECDELCEVCLFGFALNVLKIFHPLMAIATAKICYNYEDYQPCDEDSFVRAG